MKMQEESRHSQKAAPGFLFWLWGYETGSQKNRAVFYKNGPAKKKYKGKIIQNYISEKRGRKV